MIRLNGEPINVALFPDNTSQVWKLPDISYTWADISWEFSSESEFIHLAQLKTLLDSHSVKSYLTIKYLPYGRQDKEVSNTSTFALRTFATLLNSLHFSHVTIIDPHSIIATDLIKNSEAKYPIEDVMKIAYLLKIDLFCYPDKGAYLKYTGFPNIQNEIYDYPCITCNKVRNQSTGEILSNELIGDVKNKNVLIVDDICDGGMTFIKTAELLYAAGAKEVNLFVSHGIFSKGLKVLKQANIKRIFTQDGEALEYNGVIFNKNL